MLTMRTQTVQAVCVCVCVAYCEGEMTAFPLLSVKWRPSSDLPRPLPLCFFPSLLLSLSHWVINPLLFMKIYNIAMQLYEAPRLPIGRCWSYGMEP